MPSHTSFGIYLALFRSWSSVFLTTSFTRLLLPLPDTPVTQVNTPRGMSTSIFLRLFTRAHFTLSHLSPLRRLLSGRGMNLRPDRYWPVMEFSDANISSGVP